MSVMNAASVLLPPAPELSLSSPQPSATAASAMTATAASSAIHLLVFMVSCLRGREFGRAKRAQGLGERLTRRSNSQPEDLQGRRAGAGKSAGRCGHGRER